MGMTVSTRSAAWVHFRELLLRGPEQTLQAAKAWGTSGFGLVLQRFLLGTLPWPVRLEGFGTIRHIHEAVNFLENCVGGELRWPEAERDLTQAVTPLVVDIGINTGVTLRWWRHLNPRVHVIGIDMLEEAVAFSRRAWDEHPAFAISSAARLDLICSGVGARHETVEIPVEDALFGMNALDAAHRPPARSLTPRRRIDVRPLDELLAPWEGMSIDLLKIDVEGHGGHVLEGASRTLKHTRCVALETHDVDETRAASRHLGRAGLELCHIHGRTGWWRISSSFATAR